MSTDFRGDPSAALLEVLDPEQNHTFNDHYLDLDYDLSKVMFICTANTLHTIPLRCRTAWRSSESPATPSEEKLAIARQYLIPKQQEANGLTDVEVDVHRRRRSTSHPPLHARGRRALASSARSRSVCRKVARECSRTASRRRRARSTASWSRSYLGAAEVPLQRRPRSEDQVGIVNGLAWTEIGGELLPTEVTVIARQGQADHHRQARRGDAGVRAGGDDLRALARRRFGLDREFYENVDIHIHLPEGAIPKDGPSRRRHHGHRAGLRAARRSRCARTWR